MSKTILEWSYILQYKLEKMTDNELAVFLENKAIKYDGQLWGKNEQGKNSKAKRKASGTSKRSSEESKNI